MHEPDFETLDELTMEALDLIHEGDERRLKAMERLEPRLLAALDEIAVSHHASSEYCTAMNALEELRKAVDVERVIRAADFDESSPRLLRARGGIAFDR
ncbi:MAG: hypothetical protein ABI639_08565 [Thermoanaerobaculia bacterium]